MRTAKSPATPPKRRSRVASTSTAAARAKLATGVPFLDHMLDQVARHGMIDLEIEAKGDLHIDAHHTVEDIGITLGQAVAKAVGDKKGIRRYGHAYVPLDEALVARGDRFFRPAGPGVPRRSSRAPGSASSTSTWCTSSSRASSTTPR